MEDMLGIKSNLGQIINYILLNLYNKIKNKNKLL